MAQNNGSGAHWSIQRRVEGLVNKHMADMALETLQHRLSVVSEEMNHLSEEAQRRPEEDPSRHAEDPSRHADMNFDVESQSEAYSSGGSEGKLPQIAASSETAAQRKIISLLIEIKEEQKKQWVILKELQARMQGPVCDDDDETLEVDLPLRSMEQLDETERYLEDAVAQRKLVTHLSRMGGATVDDAIRRLMQAVLSFGVGSEMNWAGRGEKRSFRNTRLQGVLFRALKKTPVGKDATQHQFADVVKKWLRFAPFRQGGSGRRQHYKPTVEFICTEGTL
ncbi:uncharacterized protein [Paramormyrops kingsleyae]|uniref:Uncharacterized LOC111858443 n=1 Tax=Paramormyrops kingsleyae TaxID=1676925 RepID=A0A3B3RGB1_9TELE|nr:uncharacterized protein LOC111858443 [Paramormyrops kingsleyae]